MKITRDIADGIVAEIERHLPKSIQVELVGSIKTKGFSNKDIDLKMVFDEEDEDFISFDGDEPYHHQFLRKAGLSLVNDNIDGAEWWKTKAGVIVDLFFDDSMNESVDEFGLPKFLTPVKELVALEEKKANDFVGMEYAIMESVWEDSKNFYQDPKSKSLRGISSSLSESKTRSFPFMGKSIIESSLPPFKEIIIASHTETQKEIQSFYQQARTDKHPSLPVVSKDVEEIRKWISSPDGERLTQRGDWRKSKGLIRLSLGGILRVLFDGFIVDGILYLGECIVFDDHDYDKAEQELIAKRVEGVDDFGLPVLS